MAHSRANPSPRYRELLALYAQLHRDGETRLGITAADTFAGQSLGSHLGAIRSLCDHVSARTLLDYGSGKGLLHRTRPIRLSDGSEAESLADYWGLEHAACYDPAYPPFARRPPETFDCVVCTDVLEHCPEEDIDWILGEIFGFARLAVYISIACYPARKTLPNGENAHVTIRPPAWWRPRVETAAERGPGVLWQVIFDIMSGEGFKRVRLEGGATSP